MFIVKSKNDQKRSLPQLCDQLKVERSYFKFPSKLKNLSKTTERPRILSRVQNLR